MKHKKEEKKKFEPLFNFLKEKFEFEFQYVDFEEFLNFLLRESSKDLRDFLEAEGILIETEYNKKEPFKAMKDTDIIYNKLVNKSNKVREIYYDYAEMDEEQYLDDYFTMIYWNFIEQKPYIIYHIKMKILIEEFSKTLKIEKELKLKSGFFKPKTYIFFPKKSNLKISSCFSQRQIELLKYYAIKTYDEINKIRKGDITDFPKRIECMTIKEIEEGRKRGGGHGIYYPKDLIKINKSMSDKGILLNFVHENLHHAFPELEEMAIDLLTHFIGGKIGIIRDKLFKQMEKLR